MNRKTFFFNRIIIVMLLASVFTFAFVWTNPLASEQSNNNVENQTSLAEVEKLKTVSESETAAGIETAETITLRAEKRGSPLINLQDGKRLRTKFVGKENEAQSFISEQAQPLAMTNEDLNADGAADLIVGYAGGNGGHLALYPGNLDSLSARTPEIFEDIKAGNFPEPFLPEARLIALPIAPDFIGTGDFNRDGWKDIVAAQRGDNRAFLLLGNSRGSYKPSYVELDGRVTAMLTDNIDPLDNAADVAFAVISGSSASLLVYNNATDAFGAAPEVYPLSAPATSLAIGQLDNHDPMDIVAAGNGKVAIIHGSYPEKSDSQPEQTAMMRSAQVESLIEGFSVSAVRVGNFVWDRENRPEIALLGADGSVRILERGKLDKRPFSEAEMKTRWLRHREEMQRQEEIRNLDYQPQSKLRREKWTESDRFQTSAVGMESERASTPGFFTSARMTPLGVEDLVVMDSSSRKIHILVSNHEELNAKGASLELSASGKRASITLDVEGEPAAIMPMKLSVMNRPGIVMLDKASREISYSLAVPEATFNVSKTADTYDGACNADCSFREALEAANANMNSDIIMLPAGTYTISPALGGPDQDTTIDPAAQQSGDWDVFYDLTIMGAGQATTILQAANAQPGHDRVLDAIQTSAGIPDLTISGITIQNGRCQAGCVDGGGLRFAVDALAALTINDSTITNNRTEVTTGSPANNGGGIFGGQADYSFTNVTVTNNIAGFAVGCTNCGAEGGGAIIAFTNSTNPTSLTMTNSTFTGNHARTATTFGGRGGALATSGNSVSITGGTFSSNMADIDGGAFRIFTATTISGATISNNSAKQSGGGIWNDPLDNANNPLTNTFTNLTMRGNLADSNNATVAAGGEVTRGDGGAIFHGRGTLNLNNPTIGGTGAGEANTAFNGGGIGHSYAQFLSAAFNASTININNGGSIVGNLAINNGGGILNDATRTASGGVNNLNIGATTAVTFTNNDARNNGGGIANLTGGGSPTPAANATLTNMTLRSNRANSDSSGGGDGGALFQDLAVAGGGTTFAGTTLIIGGSGFANSAVNGGGIRNNAGTVTIPSNASITHNTATGTGGGISNNGTLSALATPTITNNTASGNGGGIHNTGTLGAITSPTLNNNSGATGGGIFSSSGILSITNGTVNGNTASTGKGGGIEHSGASASTVTGVTITGNTGSGIHITGTGSLDAANNTITNNSGDGITKIGTGTGSHFNSNIIHSNGELGIDLSDNGVTPNDANDADSGPNNLQNFPVLNYVRRGDGVANVTLNAPNGKYRIQYFKNSVCDPSGHGEGEVLMTSQVVDIVSGNTLTFFSPALAFDSGVREQITATATHDANGNNNFDDDGSTSEFSACRRVNTLPTFPTVQTPSRQQGSPVTNSQIATVADPDQPLNTLAVTIKAVGAMGAGGASQTVNGVTVSNIAVDVSGNVTADIIANCTATNASFTLRVTDDATEFNETTLNVTVTPNTPPTLGNYSNVTVNEGTSGTVVTPDAAPTDNGTVATLTASAPGFTGTFVGNTTTGTVTVNNAGPFGIYTVTVTATDNCGATTMKTFQLTVNATPTITGATISRQQGSPASNSQIATVNDNDQAENTLVVTVNGMAADTVNGVTVSNIAVDVSGNVTADVIASCTATNAGFTLTVTDSNGASSNAALTVNVTPNTPPSVGTYATTNVNAGSGTTVTPSAAPADNGSIQSATVMASAGFTGSLSVDQTTGVVTVSNANPVGSYTVTVTYTDNCGATTSPTFTLEVIDITPPDTTITANPTDPSGPNVSFSFTGSDSESGVASFECDLDGGGFTACTSPKTYTGLSQGSHTFQVRAIDNANNVDPTPASFTWTVDATPPDTVINSNPPDPSNSGNASFTFSGTDMGGSTVAGFECQLDGGGFAPCTSPQNYTGLADGSHTFEVRAIDGVGNIDPTPASFTWTVDATPPDTSITANPTNPSGSNVSFSFTGTDAGSGIASFECDLDGGGFAPCTSPQNYTGLADGSHTFQVRAIDNAGNVDPTPASFTWVVDTMPPDTTITANPTDPSGPNVSFSFTGSDAGSGVASFECDLDGGGFAPCTSPQTYTGLSQGSHTFQVRAIDNVGNIDPTPASFTWTVDATPPDTVINSNPPDPSNSGNASFTFSGTDMGGSTVAGFECQLDGGGFAPCTSPQNYTGLADGSHTFEVRAIDGVGNIDPTPASYTWVIDTTGPDTSITANPTNPSGSSSAAFSFTGTDTGGTGVASFECDLDGGGFAPCTSPQNYTGLSDGSHTFQVRAIDNAGNADASPASYTWTIDTAPPDTSIDSTPSNPTNSTSASFTFSGIDSGTGVASFECKLDGGSFAPCTSPQNYTGLSDGSHTFEVRAIDGIGNVDPTPASFTWTVDTDPPDVTINQAAGQTDPANGMGITINFTVVFNEPVTGFGNSPGDVTLSGTAGATTAVVTEIAPNDGTTYNVAVTGMTMEGTVIASIPANAAQDAAGNGNTASTSTDNTVTYIPNSPPTANPDSYSTDEDVQLNVPAPGVLFNDTDPDTGNTLTAVLVSGPSNAQSFSLNADGSFSYLPNPNYNGGDSFTYKAKDNFNAESDTVTVTLTINPVNDPPTINGATITRQQTAPGTVSIIATVGDIDNAAGTLIVTTTSVPAGITVTNITNNNGTITATVEAGCAAAVGENLVGLKVTDPDEAMGTGTLTVNVTPETTPPVINPIANVVAQLPANSNATSMPVNFPLPTATDNCGGPVTVTTDPVSGSVFNLGTTTVNVTATDQAGNQSFATFTVTVQYRFSLYNFSGLLLSEDFANQVSAGSTVPIRFSLSGNKGANPYSSPPASQQINCFTGVPIGAIQPINRTLPDPSYNAFFDFYQTTWLTQAAWRGTCRRLILSFNDGTTRQLDFRFN